MNSISKIEQSIAKISKEEANKSWQDNHAAMIQSCMELMNAALLPASYNRVKLCCAQEEKVIAAVYYTGKGEGNPSCGIPKGYEHRDSTLVKSVEFEPTHLANEIKKAWIAKEAARISDAKIKHLLSVAGVS